MKKLLFFLIFTSLFLSSFSQTDTIPTDSTDVENVNQTLDLLKQADSVRISDSIYKELLKKELEELKEYQHAEKKEIQQKLEELEKQDSIRIVALKKQIDSLKLNSVGYPIMPAQDTIFMIYTPIGKITPKERAIIVNTRVKAVYKQFIPAVDSIIIVDYGQTVDLVFNDETILSITELDELWFEKDKYEIAVEYQQTMLYDIKKFKSNRNLFSLLFEIGLSILVIIVQFFLIKLVNYLFRKKIDVFLESKKGVWFKEINIRDYQFLDAERLTNSVLAISKFFRWFINIVQLYITIPILFSIFPPTRRLAETLFTYTLTPIKKIGISIIQYIPNLFMIIIIVVITRYLMKFLRFLAQEVEDEKLKLPGFFPDWAKPTFNIIRFFVMAFMVVMVFPYLPGSDSPIFKGVSVFIGVIFSIGSSSVVGNLVAGLVITYMRPFKIGDRIKISEKVGNVIEKTPFVIRIRTPKNEYITIPNANVLSSHVINYSTSQEQEGIILHTTVTIGYDVPWRQVHELLLDAATRTERIMQHPKPYVLQTSLDDYYVSYQLNAYCDAPNSINQTYSNLHQNIQDVFFDAGVEILSPHYRAQRDGNMTTIPEKYLPKDYKQPKFNFRIFNWNMRG